MDDIETILVSLLLSVVVLGTIARLVHVPYPIVLVIGGLGLGLVLGPDDTVTLDPDLVLVIFLPPLLYSSAFFANLQDIRRGIRVVTVQAVGLVLVTMCVVAVRQSGVRLSIRTQSASPVAAVGSEKRIPTRRATHQARAAAVSVTSRTSSSPATTANV